MAAMQGEGMPVNPPTSTDRCVTCGSMENIKRCAKCMSVAYCCKEHQVHDWKKHKKDCKHMGDASKRAAASKAHAKTLTPAPSVEKNGDDGHSRDTAVMDLSFEFDKRPYNPRQFAQPDAKDPDSLALHVTAQLKLDNYCIVDNIFNPKLASAIFGEVTKLYSSGIFLDGQLSGGRTSSIPSQITTKKTIRGDKITWLEGNEKPFPYVCLLVKSLDGLLSRMNYYLKGECDIGGRTKAMVACYPGNGTGYACHVDNPNRDGRCITCLYYLNEGWDPKEHGGLLRLFRGTDDFIDVEPFLNRAIFFWSDRRNPHEVQPAFKTRYAITVWYLDKQERQEAKEAVKSQSAEDMKSLHHQYALLDLKTQTEGQTSTQEQTESDQNVP